MTGWRAAAARGWARGASIAVAMVAAVVGVNVLRAYAPGAFDTARTVALSVFLARGAVWAGYRLFPKPAPTDAAGEL